MFSLLKKNTQLDQAMLQMLIDQMQEASRFINGIQNGDLNIPIPENLAKRELGQALQAMKDYMNRIASEEEKRSWLNSGLAQFSDILRNKESLELGALSDHILSSLVKYVKANQGALFVLEGEHEDTYLEMISCYAYDKKKYLNKRFAIGDGLTGQCVLEKQTIHLKQVPEDYVFITSGLGEARPRSILISPLLINEKVFGVLELASFEEFTPHRIEFINKLSENIASTIKNVKDNERTVALLNASQQQAEELRSQEEEMRQNMEEMQATQEEMERKSNELNKATAEASVLLDGINATMATIEFTPDGIVLTANKNFLKVLKYSLEDIKGKHHRKFVPDEIVETSEYKTFWSRLAKGEAITGVFKRIDSVGNTIWLNAIYNPIFNANKQVVKVVKFATDVTAEQELLAETRGLLQGINATMATIEFTPGGTVLHANENFLKTMKYKLVDIKGEHHKKFVPQEILESEDYKNFWKRLAQGESITGIFQRIDANGNPVWLNAIYNPIFNASHQVVKVVKFATDITAEQERLRKSSS